jgi:2-polyprenyl-3-methyl-5-hydroxy-6-metoxy-1,4-benzoquinol methylase
MEDITITPQPSSGTNSKLTQSLVRLGGTVVGADASYNNIQMATLHSRKDPALWTGSGKLEYRNTTAGTLHKCWPTD